MTNNRSDSLVYFVSGLAAGAALTVLLTPRSGAAQRRAIGRKAGEGVDLLKSQVAAGRDYIRALRSDLREAKEAAGEDAGNKSAEAKSEVPPPHTTPLTT